MKTKFGIFAILTLAFIQLHVFASQAKAYQDHLEISRRTSDLVDTILADTGDRILTLGGFTSLLGTIESRLPALATLLGDSSEYVRGKIMRELSSLRYYYPDSAVPYIVKMLDDSSPQLRAHAAVALREAAWKNWKVVGDVPKALIKRIRIEEDSWVVRQLVYALGEYRNDAKTMIPVLMELFDRQDTFYHSLAASMLYSPQWNYGARGWPAVPKLIEMLKSEDTRYSPGAIQALARIGYKALPAVAELIDTGNNTELRRRAVDTLRYMALYGPAMEPAVEIFTRLLNDEDRLIRIWSLVGLGLLQSDGTNIDTALPIVQTLINHTDTELAEVARKIVDRIK